MECGFPSEALQRRNESLVQRVQSPFDNVNPWTRYEVCKAIVVGLTLFPVRFLLLLVLLGLELLVMWLATLGCPLEDDRGCLRHTRPLCYWRRLLLRPALLLNRGVLLCLGFWRICVLDQRRSPQRPRILVAAPHMSFVDFFVIAWAFLAWPGAVGKIDLLDIPFGGAFARAIQGIFVDRRNSQSRHGCKDAIAARAGGDWGGPPVVIFPEGTTTNGKVIMQFKNGPFAPGQPVLPILLRYPSRHFDVSWVGNNCNTGVMVLRMMLQFTNFCEIRILEPWQPSQVEIDDPDLFARNVRASMARHLGVPTTEHTYDDVFFSFKAAKLGVESEFEMCEMKKKYGLTYEELVALLENFRRLDSARGGKISFAEFAEIMGSERLAASMEQLHSFFDTDGSGEIDYREFVQIAALLSRTCSATSQAKLAFLVYDVEGRGRIQLGKLRTALDAAGVYAHAPPGDSQDESSPGEALLHNLAKREDDYIDFDEFSALVAQHPDILDLGLQEVRHRLGLGSCH